MKNGGNYYRFCSTAISGSNFRNGGVCLLGMKVVHKSERDLKAVALHIPQTSVAGVGSQPDQKLRRVPEALPTGWVGARGNPTAAHFE